MNLENAVDKIKADNDLAKKFEKDPKAVLADMGVDVSKVVFGEEADAIRDQSAQRDSWSVCGSVGVVACVSVGYNS